MDIHTIQCNNNIKFEDRLEVESVPTSRNTCIYINIPMSFKNSN